MGFRCGRKCREVDSSKRVRPFPLKTPAFLRGHGDARGNLPHGLVRWAAMGFHGSEACALRAVDADALAPSDSVGQGETIWMTSENGPPPLMRAALLQALPDYERLVSLFPEEGCLHGRLAGCALRSPVD